MTKAEIYQRKATEIIKESIKSVVYIDEKAWNPFEGVKFNQAVEEHIISKKLYKNLKEQGVNLNVHKFSKGEQDLPLSDSKKQYLFRDIDLVLLDWDLDERDNLNVFALKLLDDVVRQPHIHFCSIYSSSPDFDEIIQKIMSYFSGFSREDFDNIRQSIEHSEEILELLNRIDISSAPDGRYIGEINRLDREIFNQVKEITKADKPESLIAMAISIKENYPKPEVALNYPIEIISKSGSEYALIINNTVISLLKKDNNSPKNLISNFSKLISSERNKSFFKLLGLDMQNQFSKYGAFIDPDILNISFNTFMHHRKIMKESGTKPSFDDFIKNLFLENSKLHLANINLELLNDDFLNKFRVIKKNLNDNEFAIMNSFYNGGKLTGENNLGFGDIFKDSKNNYYLCITALCDCMYPSKIKNKFFFVRSTKLLDIAEAIKLGDSSHISYLNNGLCIKWSSDEEFVKPRQFYVSDPQIKDSIISLQDIINSGLQKIELQYLFTLKQNYAQRIANQAFTHPVRVGVDFVKK